MELGWPRLQVTRQQMEAQKESMGTEKQEKIKSRAVEEIERQAPKEIEAHPNESC